ncbi:hypothetical protein COW36_22665 [bacterium (Candidatus Blackallbacteria) CG17_big_fil_post_rev_8_21_14_2_50_48_46]|uniref:SMP-30/Gluconolactonase/LRE-like region domain-containing protein n=1 Tax=bacterium (Candidatus Blackallbacteria) CG17_big_fil_post_rev_8_21_14_2_50_48_46 TaxID=2014261 RepID=A0A2M7FXZ5_9BACT|nr:MAG: hypothetical protein COW64_07435 [bacterium (Candidatus Blackallbacteria) CG18_big_fil_WC_8_21_14_2_50_49_26]PIW14182.1 MAG: hypothetical protein COW36_22665 [bacterium (Candidatus Blackallbacteria) CG17_big_fil_post_rev_8_21_14_2_50_48_46]PIW46723.1 MAG: hypothetical protein COW20_14940 [bacterium (Candidatus Blackallbacteria) CG13_big_fil_rev_8_21_14_2_50_49_14]
MPSRFSLTKPALLSFLLPGVLNACASPSQSGGPQSPRVLGAALSKQAAFNWTGNEKIELLSGEGDSDFKEGGPQEAQFSYPWDIVQGPDLFFYGVDRFNHRIRKISQQGQTTTFAGQRAPGYQDGQAAQAQFDNPVGLTVDQAGNLYIADSGNHLIRKIDVKGNVSTLAGVPKKSGFQDGEAQTALFSSPSGLCLDAQGNLLIADSNNHRIRKLSADGKTVSTLVGSAEKGFLNGPALEARLNSPRDLVADSQGNLYISDGFNHAIRRLGKTGMLETWVGNGSPGDQEGVGEQARLNEPRGLDLDQAGNLYIADSGNHRIRLVSPDRSLSNFAGNGQGRFQNGSLKEGSFAMPSGLVLTPTGLAIADTQNHRIRMIRRAQK